MQWLDYEQCPECGHVEEGAFYDDGQPVIGDSIIVMTQEHLDILRDFFSGKKAGRTLHICEPKSPDAQDQNTYGLGK